MLYTKLDNIINLLYELIKAVSIHKIFNLVILMTLVFCKFQICENDCGIMAQTLTDEKDKQFKANAHIKRTTLLLDNHCTIDNNNDTENNETTALYILYEAVQSKLHQFTQQIYS